MVNSLGFDVVSIAGNQ